MKNVKNADFRQIDHIKAQISRLSGVVILTSPQAFDQFSWTRKLFSVPPKEGYFFWVKKSPARALSTCITIASPKISQEMINLVVIEKDVQATVKENCLAASLHLLGTHQGDSKIIIRAGASLNINHFHYWGEKDTVNTKLNFQLEKNAKIAYSYHCLKTPKKLTADNCFHLKDNCSANLSLTIRAKNSQVETRDSIVLAGDRANGISRIRSVADQKSTITNYSQMMAQAEATGHVDCMGLLVADRAEIRAIPELINKSRQASLTHEASVGRIQEEALNYLRSRGLTENQAIDLIVSGFLT